MTDAGTERDAEPRSQPLVPHLGPRQHEPVRDARHGRRGRAGAVPHRLARAGPRAARPGAVPRRARRAAVHVARGARPVGGARADADDRHRARRRGGAGPAGAVRRGVADGRPRDVLGRARGALPERRPTPRPRTSWWRSSAASSRRTSSSTSCARCRDSCSRSARRSSSRSIVAALLLLDGQRLSRLAAGGLGSENPVFREAPAIARAAVTYFGVRIRVNAVTAGALLVLMLVLGVDDALLWAVGGVLPELRPLPRPRPRDDPADDPRPRRVGPARAPRSSSSAGPSLNLVAENLLEPTLTGRALSLSTWLVFIMFFFWVWLLGPVGALLSMPITVLVVLVLAAQRADPVGRGAAHPRARRRAGGRARAESGGPSVERRRGAAERSAGCIARVG